MLRGAIELVSDERIDGWLYSDVGEVFDRTVLAYVDDRCVGSGRIGILRNDLKAAGLADGRLGFSFPIAAAGGSDLQRVIVKLEGSDFFMLQDRATIAKAELFQAPVADIGRLDWMRGRGMLAPAEAAFLKYIQQLGVFDYPLVQPKTAGSVGPTHADPLKTAQGFLDLLLLRGCEFREIRLAAVSNFEDLPTRVLAKGGRPLSIVAIWSAAAVKIGVVEGSQIGRRKDDRSLQGAIDYCIGPDRLLFVDLRAKAQLSAVNPVELKVFVAY